MNLLMFVTDDTRSAEGTGPTLLVKDSPNSVLPEHPRGLSWRYFASLHLDDALLATDRQRIVQDITRRGFFVSPKLVYVPAADERETTL
jgi:hypothetical protein